MTLKFPITSITLNQFSGIYFSTYLKYIFI